MPPVVSKGASPRPINSICYFHEDSHLDWGETAIHSHFNLILLIFLVVPCPWDISRFSDSQQMGDYCYEHPCDINSQVLRTQQSQLNSCLLAEQH